MNQTGKPTLAALFRSRPATWGLRGDPGLWEELEQALAGQPAPDCAEALKTLLLDTIEEVLGEPLVRGENRFVPRFARGGMSSGMVCGDFWFDTALPLLQRRWLESAA